MAGLAFPEINTSIRALLAGDRAALSWSAGLFEVAAVLGPLLASWTIPWAFGLLFGASLIMVASADLVVLILCSVAAGAALTPITVLANMLAEHVGTISVLLGSSVLAGGAATGLAGWLFDVGGPRSAFALAAVSAGVGLWVALSSKGSRHEARVGP